MSCVGVLSPAHTGFARSHTGYHTQWRVFWDPKPATHRGQDPPTRHPARHDYPVPPSQPWGWPSPRLAPHPRYVSPPLLRHPVWPRGRRHGNGRENGGCGHWWEKLRLCAVVVWAIWTWQRSFYSHGQRTTGKRDKQWETWREWSRAVGARWPSLIGTLLNAMGRLAVYTTCREGKGWGGFTSLPHHGLQNMEAYRCKSVHHKLLWPEADSTRVALKYSGPMCCKKD